MSTDPTTHPHSKWQNNMLLRKGKIVVGNNTSLQQMILSWMHNSSQGGHSGVLATLKRAQTLFFWPRMKETVVACWT